MIKLETAFTIPSVLERAWPAIRDADFVASCIPGAQITDTGQDGIHKGEITFRFGPTVAVFRGNVQLNYDDANHTCTIKGSGLDKKGASKAIADFVLTATEANGSTAATLKGGFNVVGPLEMFAKSGGVHVARALTEEFASNLAKALDKVSPADVSGTGGALPSAADGEGTILAESQMQRAAPAATAASTAATGRILFRILLGWLSSLFTRGKNTTG